MNCVGKTYRFVEHAGLAVFVFSARTIDETITKDVIVDTSVAAHNVGCRAREALHSVLCRWALYIQERKKERKKKRISDLDS